MTTTIRMLRSLYGGVLNDLMRPHDFAAERVGFLYGRAAIGTAFTQVLLTNYEPVADADYVRDPVVGARIGSMAIRAAMQRVLTTGEVAVHVHLHDHCGTPHFSWVDERELARLVPCFGGVAPAVPHGALVFSRDNGVARMWMPGSSSPEYATSVSSVGRPTGIWRHA